MAFKVWLTGPANSDLEELYEFISGHDSRARADYVLDRIDQAFSSLAERPHRGSYPPEILLLGVRAYREVFFKPYRIIYQIIGKDVYVKLIADGRRDMQTLLHRRLMMDDKPYSS